MLPFRDASKPRPNPLGTLWLVTLLKAEGVGVLVGGFMTKTILLGCVLMLAGCGTAHLNPANDPAAMRLSDKSPEAIVSCMTTRAPTGWTTSPIHGGGFRLGSVKSHNSVEVRPKGEGSEVSYYTLYGSTGVTNGCV